MKCKLKDFWGKLTLVSETDEFEIEGQLVRYKGRLGRLWLISDSGSTNMGHGMGSMNLAQVILCTDDLGYIKVVREYGGDYDIDLLEE